jgi:truncated hemoglobin YjbI
MALRTSAPHNSVFDRVGGHDRVAEAVGRLFNGLRAVPELAALLPPLGTDELRWQAQLLLTEVLGGPLGYDGPEPRAIAERVGITAGQAAALIDQVVASFAATGPDRGVTASLRAALMDFAIQHGLITAALSPTRAALLPRSEREILIEQAVAVAAGAGPGQWNLFVLDRELTVVHLDAAATAAATTADAELRRAFNLGAADLQGSSVFRFHPAPTRLQALFADPAQLPHETIWSFGRAVWRARLLHVADPGGRSLGFAVAWRDESEAHRADEVFQRLRAQAEELPVPVMFPGPDQDLWFGNAACEQALERLAPHLRQPVVPFAGVPIALLFPDEERRRALFGNPASLPHKEQVRIGPETVSILVTPVRDQDQRYLGPQITWEIVHAIKATDRAVPPSPPADAPTPVPVGCGVMVAVHELRQEARALESTAQELSSLVRLLDLAADHAEGQTHLGPAVSDVELPHAVRLVEAATAALQAARQAQPSVPRREAVSRALDTIDGIARRTNRLAIETALLAVQDDVTQAALSLRDRTRALTESLRETTGRAADSADALRQAVGIAARLEQLRALLVDDEGAAASA